MNYVKPCGCGADEWCAVCYALEVEERRLTVAKPSVCAWVYDDTHDKHDTACGHAFQFSNDGGIIENGFIYCPWCGKRIVI